MKVVLWACVRREEKKRCRHKQDGFSGVGEENSTRRDIGE